MDLDPLKDWVKAQARREALACGLYGAGCLLFGSAALGITSIPVVFLASALGQPIATVTLPITFIIALFLINARTRRYYEQAAIKQEQQLHPAARTSRLPATLLSYPGFESGNPLHYLLLGPRLSHIGYAHLQQALALHQLNLHDAALTLHTLLAAGKRLPIEHLLEHLNLNNPAPLLLNLRQIPGILLLTQPPAAMTLASELRRELHALVGPLPPLPRLTSNNERAAAALQAVHNAIGILPQGPATPPAPKPAPRRKLRIAPSHPEPSPPTSTQKEPPPNPADIWQQHRPRKP
ncbi:MAG: hypothetical protein ACO34E_17940 [Limisphaerales bacterium]